MISAVFVNRDGLHHVGPGLKGLTEAEISGLVGELVTSLSNPAEIETQVKRKSGLKGICKDKRQVHLKKTLIFRFASKV